MTNPVPPPTPPADPKPSDPPAAPPANPPGDPAKPQDPPLGEGGMKALTAEREARKALEKQLASLAPLQKLAEALAGGDKPNGKTEVELLNERLASHETDLAAEREARWRAEVAIAKGLTAVQSARLRGKTRDELLADADALLAEFPAAPAGPRTPAPDPSQGSRGGAGALDLDAQIAEAQKNGDYKAVIRLNGLKMQAAAKK